MTQPRRWASALLSLALASAAAGAPITATPAAAGVRGTAATQNRSERDQLTTVRELHHLIGRHDGLAEVGRLRCARRDAAACQQELWRRGGLWVELQMEVGRIERRNLPLEQRVDLDVLAWRVAIAVARHLDPGSTPDRASYATSILTHVGEPLDAREIHERGLAEVARVRVAMERLVREQNPDAELAALLDAARIDPRLYARSGEELRGAARAIAERIDEALPRAFALLPATPYTIELSGGGRSGVMAFYDRPEGRRGGRVMLNADPDQVPLFLLEALLVHEAMPGHHLQQSLAVEHAAVPEWRAGYLHTEYVEGWGLYAESLGDDLAIYRHPLMQFGRLNLEMWRALRLVVDTGIHAFDWDLERAVELFGRNTALPEQQIRVEVRRYRQNPGQAIAYKIGEQRFLQLRKRAEQALGERFDLREFHATLLRRGPMPMKSLSEIVDDWIRELV